jgi:putative sterol carrier protein
MDGNKMDTINYEELIQFVKDSFLPEKAMLLNYAVQIKITGIDKEDWNMQIQNQKCTISQGIFANPNSDITLSKDTLVKLVQKQLNPAMAMLTGKISMQGDYSGIIKLVNLFNFDPKKVDQLLAKIR